MRTIRILSVFLLIASIAAISVSAAQLLPSLWEERQSASLYAELSALHEARQEDVSLPRASRHPADALAEPGPVAFDDHPGEETTSAQVHAGLLELHRLNPDCVAWIAIPGTGIEYPIMYRPEEKDYYLHRDFRCSRSSAGTLYIAEICDPFVSDSVIIYGHHMRNGTMFAALTKYKEKSFWAEHPAIILDTLTGPEEYEILFAFTTPVYTGHDFQFYAFANAGSAEDFNAYVDACRSRALYDTGKTAAYGDRLLTLSTCEYSQRNGRMVVVARKCTEERREAHGEASQNNTNSADPEA